MKPDAHGPERWPDLIAVLGTLDRPALLAAATDLARAENKTIEQSMTQQRPFEDRDWWMRAFRAARARAELLALAPEDRRVADAGFEHWASVPGLTAAGPNVSDEPSMV